MAWFSQLGASAESWARHVLVTCTPEYAPRLRARHQVEENLALDAASRGWDREVERHRCTSQRIEKLLADFGEAVEDPDDTPEEDRC